MKSQMVSRLIVGACFLAITLVAIAGCITETKYVTVDGDPAPQVSAEYKTAMGLLPPGAGNVKELGNHYFTYEFEGQKFLFTFYYGDRITVRQSIPLTKACGCGTMNPTKGKTNDGPGLVE